MTEYVFRNADARLWRGESPFLMFVEANAAREEPLVPWFTEHKDAVLSALADYGVVYFRGFPADTATFEAIADVIAPDPIPYLGGVSPRHQVLRTVYTSTDAPPDLGIVQHHEMAYHHYAPSYVFFYCDEPAAEGGATPVCDSRAFTRGMDTLILDRLEREGTLYVRNYASTSPLKSWAETYGTSDKARVESLLAEGDTKWEWRSGERLRTLQRRPAILRDDRSGERVLFACVHLWSDAYFGPVARAFRTELAKDPWEQWNASFFGSGAEIPRAFIEEMNCDYAAQQIAVPWQKTDFMIVNNLIATHGRDPSRGDRRIYATLRQAFRLAERS